MALADTRPLHLQGPLSVPVHHNEGLTESEGRNGADGDGNGDGDILVVVVSHFQLIGFQLEKATLQGGESRS